MIDTQEMVRGRMTPWALHAIWIGLFLIVGVLFARWMSHKPGAPPPSAVASAAAQATSTPPASPTAPSPTAVALSSSSPEADLETPQAMPTRAGATTSVRLEDPVMCRSVDNDGRPVEPTQRFEPTWPFFCSARARGIEKGTLLVAVWRNPVGQTQKRQVISRRKGDFFVYFSLSPRIDRPWELGRYSVSLIADGVLLQSVDFSVATPAPDARNVTEGRPSGAAAHILEAIVCTGVDAQHRPLTPAAVFPPTTPSVFVAVRAHDVREGKVVLTKWYLGNRKVKEIPLQVPRDGSGWLSFRLSAPTRGGTSDRFPISAYTVEVYYDGALARTVPFSVR